MAAPIPISVLVPTVYPPPWAWAVAEILHDQVAEIGGEVIVASGHEIATPVPPPPCRVLHEPGADVFGLRAAAAAAARGDVVVVLEDHIAVPDDYCARVVEAFEGDDDVLAIVGTVSNGAPKVLDRASFLVTWGPFLAPLAGVPEDRCPPPGAIVFRRAVLPTTAPPVGWLEYQLPVELREQGRMKVAERVAVTHIQTSRRAWLHAAVPRRARLQRARPRAGRVVRPAPAPAARGGDPEGPLRSDACGLRRSGVRETVPCMTVVAAFGACNALGQMVGVLRGAGESPKHLE